MNKEKQLSAVSLQLAVLKFTGFIVFNPVSTFFECIYI